MDDIALMMRSICDKESKGQYLTYNSMFYWWPKIKDLDVSKPRTEMVYHGSEAYIEDFGRMFGGKMSGVTKWFDKVFDATKNFQDGPIFIRGDQTSGKHSWKKTCYVEDRSRESVFNHLKELANDHEMKMWLGPPLLGYAVRELIPTRSCFNAFHGEMPVTREWRYFYLDGKVVCKHPYWPYDAIEQGTDTRYLRGDWKILLDKINTEVEEEVEILTKMAIKIGRALEDELARGWSIDFLQGADGQYYFIDCAMAEMSYHWDGCKNIELFNPVKTIKGEDLKKRRDAKDDANGKVQTPDIG